MVISEVIQPSSSDQLVFFPHNKKLLSLKKELTRWSKVTSIWPNLLKLGSTLLKNNLTSIMKNSCSKHFPFLTNVILLKCRGKWIHHIGWPQKNNECIWRALEWRINKINFEICESDQWPNILQRLCQDYYHREDRMIWKYFINKYLKWSMFSRNSWF